MKKLLIILFLATVSVTGISQQLTFRAYSVEQDTEEGKEYLSSEKTGIVFFDLDNFTIYTKHPEFNEVYHITTKGRILDQGTDDDGDPYKIIYWEAIDSERIACGVEVTIYIGLGLYNYSFYYSNVTFRFRTEIVD